MKILRPEEVISFPPPRPELSLEELAEAYALARAAFTAEDLQRFTETDEGIPLEDILAELEGAEKKCASGLS